MGSHVTALLRDGIRSPLAFDIVKSFFLDYLYMLIHGLHFPTVHCMGGIKRNGIYFTLVSLYGERASPIYSTKARPVPQRARRQM
jgi:hypothetical protein